MAPIRILHVVTYMGRGGLETMLMNYYRHIDRTQVQFDFLTHREFRADYDDEIEALGGHIYRLPRLIPWSRHYRKALNVFFDEHKEYRIIHVHQDCMSSVVLIAAKKHNVPVRIAHSHNSSQDKNLKYCIKLYYRSKITRYATDLFACSNEAGNWMFNSSDYTILNNAIEIDNYVFCPGLYSDIRKDWGIEDKLVIGHVGRFAPQKNHNFLIDVFIEIKQQYENAVLFLVGDGELRSEIKRKVDNHKLADSVIFTGIRDDIPQLMQAMDAFLLPSHYEGLGIVAVEAQAAGLPCFLSDTVAEAACVTHLAKKISLKLSAKEWARIILESIPSERNDTSRLIKKAGYDIEENAKWLQNYYMEQWKANE